MKAKVQAAVLIVEGFGRVDRAMKAIEGHSLQCSSVTFSKGKAVRRMDSSSSIRCF